MATLTSAPVDQELFAGVRAGDERALERLVHLRFADLVDVARRELGGDATRAPRAAEHALLRTWDQRDRLETPAALDRALDDAVHQGVARERGRAAAVHRLEERQHTHRAAHGPPEATADMAWSHICAVLHHAPESAAEHAERLRHGTAQHMRAATSGPKVGLTAIIALAVAALAAVAYFTVDRSSDELRATRGLAAKDARVVDTRPAQQANLALDAQTRAALQPDSRLTTPAGFGPRMRVAGLAGAAMFTVAPEADLPLEVRAGPVTVRSANGEVAVRAYANEPAAVMVRKGSATVRTAAGSETLEAGRAVQVAANGQLTPLAGDARDATLGWTDGRFVVVDRPLREVLPALGRWYDLQVQAPSPAMLDRRITLRAPLGSSRAALAALDSSAGLTYEWQDRRMVLRDRAAGAAPARQ